MSSITPQNQFYGAGVPKPVGEQFKEDDSLKQTKQHMQNAIHQSMEPTSAEGKSNYTYLDDEIRKDSQDILKKQHDSQKHGKESDKQ